MKKLLAAAVAATMSATAMADISITGDAEFNYDNNTVNTAGTKTSSNTTNTEINFYVKGKNGDTSVVADLQLAGDNNNNISDTITKFQAGGTRYFVDGSTQTVAAVATSTSTALDQSNGIVVENLYITTKLGPVNAKVGNYSSSTTGILGEIDEGSRSNGKMTFDYTVNGIKFYAGNSGNSENGDAINNNMFVGVVATVEGWKLEAKKVDENTNAFGVSGTAGPVGIRFEYKDAKSVAATKEYYTTLGTNTGAITTFNNDGKRNVMFLNLTTAIDNINLGLAYLKADNDGLITETDSSIFVRENGNDGGNENIQLSATMAIDGTTYGAYVGKIGTKDTSVNDKNYYKVSAKRALASGVTAGASYTDWETDNNSDTKNFSVDLTVAF